MDAIESESESESVSRRLRMDLGELVKGPQAMGPYVSVVVLMPTEVVGEGHHVARVWLWMVLRDVGDGVRVMLEAMDRGGET